MKGKAFLKEHRVAIVLAILVSLIVAFPQVYFRIDHKDDGIYQGIELLPDSPWSPRVREIQDGNGLGSIYYQDGKGNPYLFQPLGSIMVGYAGKLLSLDINNTLLLSRLLFTFAAFLLIYYFAFLISRNKLAAVSSASVLLLAESALSYFGISQLLQGMSPEDFLRIGRPVIPVTVYIFSFGFLISFLLFYKKRYWFLGVLSAVLLGLNFYNYFYAWTYLFAFGGIFGLFLLFKKQWKDALQVALVFIGGLLAAVPYGINLYLSTIHPVYQEASVRFGIVETHAPLFVGFVVLVALALFLWRFPRDNQQNFLIGLALLLAPFVTLNQQLITGMVLQPAHYHWFFHKPMAVIFVFAVLFFLLARFKPSYQKMLATLIIVTSFAIGVFVQVSSYGSGSSEGGEIAVERQRYGPVMQWLNQHASAEEGVVLANNEISHITTIYTPLNVSYHRAAIYSLSATHDRLLDTLFVFYRLRGVGDEDVRKTFFEERGYISWNLYGMNYRELFGSYDSIPDEKIEEVVAQYTKTLATPTDEWLENTLRSYDVAYVIWDRREDPAWQLEQYDFLSPTSTFGDLGIYEFTSQ